MNRLNRFLRFGVFGVSLCTMLFMAACEPSKGGLPNCAWDELDRPVITFPEFYEIVASLTPTITWTYPGTTCIPDHYQIDVWGSRNYPVGASADYYVAGGRPTGTRFDWPDEAPLRPGHTYYVILSSSVAESEGYPGGPGTLGVFSTGPICSSGATPTAPRLLWHLDGSTIDTSDGFELEWKNTMPCWPDWSFQIQVSTSPGFTSLVIDDADTHMEALWVYSSMVTELPIQNCTRYYWRVRPNLSDREDEPFSETWSFDTRIPGTVCPLGPFITPIPDFSLEPEDVPGPMTPMAAVGRAANCRSGPGMDYPVLDILPEGISLPIDGRNGAGTWWRVDDPNLQADCWLADNLAGVSGEVSQVPVIQVAPFEAAPTDTHAPGRVNCARYGQDQKACTGDLACSWDPNHSPNSPCVNR